MATPSPSQSIWNYKPWWCQPWSIVATGAIAIVGSWLLLHRWWLTVLVAVPVGGWWAIFLLAFPRMARESGLLDAYQQSADQSVEAE